MPKIHYQFADGYIDEIDVTEKFKKEYEFLLVRERALYWKEVKQKQRAKIPTAHDWSLNKMLDDGIDYVAKNDPLENFIRREERQEQLKKLFSLLSDKQKQVYILHEIKGYSKVKIAALLNIDEKAVRKRLIHAKKRIFKKLF